MDNLGSEIGQKMRSAVKAKLIELGTGGSAGYIDDELPDYVMIMVANKRSMQQMVSDLNLFLGCQTELFVTWLHEVLDKLQEVTLPAGTVSKKRKSGHAEDPSTSKKDNKKLKRKDKKSPILRENTKINLEHEKYVENSNYSTPVIASISDLFVDEFLEKEKQTQDLKTNTATYIKNNKIDTNESAETKRKKSTNEFDIPSISEISSYPTQVDIPISNSREKDMHELERIQKKIYIAKKHLRETGELNEDFENADKHSTDELSKAVMINALHPKLQRKTNSPIFFKTGKEKPSLLDNKQEQTYNKRTLSLQSTPIESFNFELDKLGAKPSKKRPVHERLGLKKPETEQQSGRQNKSLYVPLFRRNESNKEIDQHPRSSQHTDTNRNGGKNMSPRPTEQTCTRLSQKSDKLIDISQKTQQRIVSRVIVAPKHKNMSDEDLLIDKSINSIIKIKPRPPMSPSKQASKNLLLRAVAEAQRSTTQAKSKKEESFCQIDSKIRKKNCGQKNYYISPESALRSKSQNLLIEVEVENSNKHCLYDRVQALHLIEDEEYVPETISTQNGQPTEYIYVPQMVDNNNCNINEVNPNETDDMSNDKMYSLNTQFVVTLTDEKITQKYKSLKTNLSSYTPQESKPQNHINLRWKASQTQNNKSPSFGIYKNKKDTTKSLRVDAVKDLNNVKTVICNDSKGYSTSSKKYNETTNTSLETAQAAERSTTPPYPPNSTISTTPRTKPEVKVKHKPIKFDLDIEPKYLSGVERQFDCSDVNKLELEKNIEEHNEQRKITIRTIEDKKYDNIPSLSFVAIDSTVKSGKKPKERCKYHPNCTKQFCDFYHPTAACKAFPNCKYGEKCMYTHPNCKYEETCTNLDCTFFHSEPRNPNLLQPTAPPLSSHVVPVQNYKSISASTLAYNAMCKYYPDCTKVGCTFYHPKACRFGKNCVNKLECNFYHHEVQSSSKFKWVASGV